MCLRDMFVHMWHLLDMSWTNPLDGVWLCAFLDDVDRVSEVAAVLWQGMR